MEDARLDQGQIPFRLQIPEQLLHQSRHAVVRRRQVLDFAALGDAHGLTAIAAGPFDQPRHQHAVRFQVIALRCCVPLIDGVVHFDGVEHFPDVSLGALHALALEQRRDLAFS